MAGYTKTGPFTNNQAPGISAQFLNNMENWIQQTEGDTGSVSVSGSTSGSATMYQVFQGTFKFVIVVFTNFRNGGGGAQTLALPVAFTMGGMFQAGDIPASVSLKSGASAITLETLTTLAASGNGGSTTNNTTMWPRSLGFANGGWDTLSIGGGATQATPSSTFLYFQGI